jgi:hypothetical protein
LNDPGESEDNCEADDESDIERGTGITDSEQPQHRVVSAATTVNVLIRPTKRSTKQAKQRLMSVSAKETRRNKGNMKS